MPRRIDTQAIIDAVRLEEQVSDPSTPASGYGLLYAKADGLYYMRDDGVIEGKNIGARVYNNANQAVSTGVVKTLAFNSEYYDYDTIHDTSTNNERLTCKTAGIYIVTLQIVSDTTLTAVDDSAWVEHDTRGRVAQASFDDGKSLTLSCIIDLAVNDYLVAKVYQQTTASINIVYASGNEYSPTFSMHKIA